jgi:hypothetical protein
MIERFRNLLEMITGSRATLAEVLDDEIMRNAVTVGAHEVAKIYNDKMEASDDG